MSKLNPIEPVVLTGKNIRLEPLNVKHANDLVLAGTNLRLNLSTVPNKNTIDSYINLALTMQKTNGALPFVIIENTTGKIIGSTRFYSVEAINKRVSIGYSWISPDFQRSGVNTECKYLMLRHAFEVLDVNAAIFITDCLNFKSQQAIKRIGAKQDGVLRNYDIMPDGRVRDVIIYSIIKSEWPNVKIYLDYLINEKYS